MSIVIERITLRIWIPVRNFTLEYRESLVKVWYIDRYLVYFLRSYQPQNVSFLFSSSLFFSRSTTRSNFRFPYYPGYGGKLGKRGKKIQYWRNSWGKKVHISSTMIWDEEYERLYRWLLSAPRSDSSPCSYRSKDHFFFLLSFLGGGRLQGIQKRNRRMIMDERDSDWFGASNKPNYLPPMLGGSIPLRGYSIYR